MTDSRTHSRTHSRTKKFARRAGVLLVGAASIATAGALVSSALFTTQATTDGTFDAGSVNISATPSSAAFTFTKMAPGDTVIAPVTVANSGNLEMRYAVSATATGTDAAALGSALKMKIKSGLTAAQCTTANVVNMNNTTTGVLIYGTAGTATTGLVTDTAIMGTATKTPIVGNPATGQNAVGTAPGLTTSAGADRLLPAAGSEILCVQITLPLATTSSVMNNVAGLTLTFDGEQTKNNV